MYFLMRRLVPLLLSLLLIAPATAQMRNSPFLYPDSVPGPYGRPVPDTPLKARWAENEENDIEVVGVMALSGDSVVVRPHRGKEYKVYLADVIAPLPGQGTFGASQGALQAIVAGRELLLRVKGNTSEGTPVVWAYLDDGAISINEAMVQNGWAWVYRQNVSDPHLIILEEEAKMNRDGLFQMKSVETPWDYQRRIQENLSRKSRTGK